MQTTLIFYTRQRTSRSCQVLVASPHPTLTHSFLTVHHPQTNSFLLISITPMHTETFIHDPNLNPQWKHCDCHYIETIMFLILRVTKPTLTRCNCCHTSQHTYIKTSVELHSIRHYFLYEHTCKTSLLYPSDTMTFCHPFVVGVIRVCYSGTLKAMLTQHREPPHEKQKE